MSASTYTEREKTIVRVYFLHGASEQTIADLCRSYGFAPNTKGKVSGIVNREKLRNLSDRDRQARNRRYRGSQNSPSRSSRGTVAAADLSRTGSRSSRRPSRPTSAPPMPARRPESSSSAGRGISGGRGCRPRRPRLEKRAEKDAPAFAM